MRLPGGYGYMPLTTVAQYVHCTAGTPKLRGPCSDVEP